MKLTEVKYRARSVIGFVKEAVPGPRVEFAMGRTPRFPVRALRLVVSESSSTLFDILSIRVAGKELLPADGAVPSRAFSEKDAPSFYVPLTTVGDEIVLVARSIAATPIDFRAWMYVLTERSGTNLDGDAETDSRAGSPEAG